MEYEEFLAAEHKLHLSTDKVYRAHLKKLETLSERQVTAQEAMVKGLEQFLKVERDGSATPTSSEHNTPKGEN